MQVLFSKAWRWWSQGGKLGDRWCLVSDCLAGSPLGSTWGAALCLLLACSCYRSGFLHLSKAEHSEASSLGSHALVMDAARLQGEGKSKVQASSPLLSALSCDPVEAALSAGCVHRQGWRQLHQLSAPGSFGA